MFNTDKQRLLKSSWNRSPLSSTARFPIIPNHFQSNIFKSETLKHRKYAEAPCLTQQLLAALQIMQSKKLSFKNDRCTYYKSLLPISLLQRSCETFFLYHLRNSSEAYRIHAIKNAQPAFSCSKLTTETLEQSLKYVQS